MPDTEPNIPKPLRRHIVPIDTIAPWPGNPRTGDIDAIAASMKEHGQWRVAVVQKSSGQIVIGNNMWFAARERLDWSGLAAITLDLPDDEAKRMLARDNKTSDDGTYDIELLADFLGELADTEQGLAGTGYTDTELDELLKTTGALGDQTADFLDQFTSPEPAPAASPGTPPPIANPFPVAGAPQQPPAGPTIPAQTSADSAPDNQDPPAANPVHTGPATYTGPGAPSPAGQGAPLPEAPPVATVQWVVLLDQRETIRAALKLAQRVGGHDNASAALTDIAAHYLATANGEAASADAAGETA